jgi:protein MpaA
MTIDLIKRFSADNGLNVLVIGVFHGDEPQGEYFINKFLGEAQNPPLKNNLFYIPCLNPSGVRKNKNGVDLNRNFPTKNWELGDKNSNYFGGESPASEQETKFVVNLMNEIKFDAIITIHAPFKIINYDCNSPKTVKLAEKISEFLGYPTKCDIGYPTPGSFGTYAGVERNIPTITIEIDEEIDPSVLYPKFEKMFEYLENEFAF